MFNHCTGYFIFILEIKFPIGGGREILQIQYPNERILHTLEPNMLYRYNLSWNIYSVSEPITVVLPAHLLEREKKKMSVRNSRFLLGLEHRLLALKGDRRLTQPPL